MSNFVNLWQSPEDRQAKYHLARSLGVDYRWARRMRDWRLSKIERLFHIQFQEQYNNAPIIAPYAQFLLPGFTPQRQGKLDALPP